MFDKKKEVKVKVYVANRLPFTEAGRIFTVKHLNPAIQECGYEIIDSWSLVDPELFKTIKNLPLGPEKQEKLKEFDDKTFVATCQAIDECDLVVAILEGMDAYSGVAGKVGYSYAKGKRIQGYRSDTRLSAENIGAQVSINLEGYIRHSGGKISTSLKELQQVLKGDLTFLRNKK